jgi:hypothetical protein
MLRAGSKALPAVLFVTLLSSPPVEFTDIYFLISFGDSCKSVTARPPVQKGTKRAYSAHIQLYNTN